MGVYQTVASDLTPEIHFDIQNSIYEIRGKSTPINAKEFYLPAINWLKGFFDDIKDNCVLSIELEYLNPDSFMWLIEILRIFKRKYDEGAEIAIEWIIETGDEEIRDYAKELEIIADMPIIVKTK